MYIHKKVTEATKNELLKISSITVNLKKSFPVDPSFFPWWFQRTEVKWNQLTFNEIEWAISEGWWEEVDRRRFPLITYIYDLLLYRNGDDYRCVCISVRVGSSLSVLPLLKIRSERNRLEKWWSFWSFSKRRQQRMSEWVLLPHLILKTGFRFSFH